MTYNGLINASNPDVPHLGGSVVAGDPLYLLSLVWDYAISRFAQIRSGFGKRQRQREPLFPKRNLKVLAVEGLRKTSTVRFIPRLCTT